MRDKASTTLSVIRRLQGDVAYSGERTCSRHAEASLLFIWQPPKIIKEILNN